MIFSLFSERFSTQICCLFFIITLINYLKITPLLWLSEVDPLFITKGPFHTHCEVLIVITSSCVHNVSNMLNSLSLNLMRCHIFIQVELLLGKAYSDWGHVSDAVAVYDQLIASYPNDFRGYLAKVLFSLTLISFSL